MTTETLWIVVAVVAAVLLIAVVLGLVLRRRRRISLRDAEELEGGTRPDTAPPRRGGTYQAGSGFNFSAGTDTARPPTAEKAPSDTAAPKDDVTARPADGPPHAVAPTSDTATTDAPPADTAATAPETRGPATGGPATNGSATTAPGRTDAEGPTPDEGPSVSAAGSASAPPDSTDVEGATSGPPASSPPTTSPGPPPTGSAPTGPAPAETVRPDTAPVTPGPPASGNGAAPATAPPAEDIAPAEGRLERLRGRLARSRSGFGQGLLGLLGAGELDEESWEDVEATLLQADLGPEMTVELVDTLRSEMARRAVRTPAQARALLRDVLTDALRTDLDRSIRALPHDGRPAVLLVVGVNGTGKTTTTGKLARVLVAGGRHIVLGAADTFRAAAAEQLMTWGERAGATVVRGAEGADPASVAFDAVKQGTDEGADAVLLDTAGRLHTKTGLMDELGKVKRVVERQAEVDEVLLVLDATTGQNGLTQARVFGDVVKVTGIVLTKLDGTAKGGIVVAVQRKLGVPVKLIGLGEGPDDLAPFDAEAFVDAIVV